MKNKAVKLLEKYVEGKDLDRYKILESIYRSNAVVSFEIEADNIIFPKEIRGNGEIAKVLSADFNGKYDLVKTYYLTSDFPELENLQIFNQNWLVMMREKSSGCVMVGTGYYNWEFVIHNLSELKIIKHKIFIYSMLELPNGSIDLLHELQNTFNYPWEEKKKVVQVLQPFDELNQVRNYLGQ